jgi:branched-chain amino acid transport system permease protein
MAIIYTINAFGKVTGGIIGISGIPPLFQSASKIPYYYFFFLLMIFIAVILYKFEFSRIGLHLKAIAESHLLASSLGINEVRYRIMVVGVGCFFAGLIGASLSHYLMVAAPAQYDFNISFWILMYVLIGGRNSFAGPFVGVIILFLIPEFFRDLKQYSPYLTASILIIITYLMPEGVTGLIKRIGIWYVNRKTRTEEVEIHTT